MPYFITEQLFFLGIATIIYLFIRKLPQISGFEEILEKKENKEKAFLVFWHGVVEKFDNKFVQLLEKLLRKLKVVVMKLDNYVSRYLKATVSRGNGNSDSQPSIFDDEENNDKVDEVIGEIDVIEFESGNVDSSDEEELK